jgi:hypothetical protein
MSRDPLQRGVADAEAVAGGGAGLMVVRALLDRAGTNGDALPAIGGELRRIPVQDKRRT